MLAGIVAGLTSQPLFAVRDNQAHNTTTIGLIYYDGANWGHVAAAALVNGGVNYNMGASVAVTDITPQVSNGIREGDAVFAVSTHGNLEEVRFACTNNAGVCNGGFAANLLSDHGNGGAALDYSSDSLAASWYHDANGYWAVAYTRNGST